MVRKTRFCHQQAIAVELIPRAIIKIIENFSGSLAQTLVGLFPVAVGGVTRITLPLPNVVGGYSNEIFAGNIGDEIFTVSDGFVIGQGGEFVPTTVGLGVAITVLFVGAVVPVAV